MDNKNFTLRNKINEAKDLYIGRYGLLDWRWHDEGLVYAIQDYHSSVGSVLDFTADDEAVLKENGLTITDAIEYCGEGTVTEAMYRAVQLGWREECVIPEASDVALYRDWNGGTHVFVRCAAPESDEEDNGELDGSAVTNHAIVEDGDGKIHFYTKILDERESWTFDAFQGEVQECAKAVGGRILAIYRERDIVKRCRL